MESQADTIARLEGKIEEIEGLRSQLELSNPLYLAFTKDISLIRQERLLLMGQQGKFAPHISVVLSHSYR